MAPGFRTDELTPRIERLEADVGHLTEDLRAFRGEFSVFRQVVTEEFRSLREEVGADNRALRRELAAEFRSIREELSTLHGRLAMIGFGLVGSVLASAVAVIIAING